METVLSQKCKARFHTFAEHCNPQRQIIKGNTWLDTANPCYTHGCNKQYSNHNVVLLLHSVYSETSLNTIVTAFHLYTDSIIRSFPKYEILTLILYAQYISRPYSIPTV